MCATDIYFLKKDIVGKYKGLGGDFSFQRSAMLASLIMSVWKTLWKTQLENPLAFCSGARGSDWVPSSLTVLLKEKERRERKGRRERVREDINKYYKLGI